MVEWSELKQEDLKEDVTNLVQKCHGAKNVLVIRIKD